MGPRGDAIVEFDWCVGVLLATLEQTKLLDDTLIILSSDNGPVLDDGYKDGAAEKVGEHKPAGPFRGGKYSAFEGGTRIPFIVNWRRQVKPGTSDAVVSQVDLLASLAALAGQAYATNQAPDSRNLLPALLGKSTTGREEVVEHARMLALRRGDWKYIEPSQGPAFSPQTKTELGADPGGLLFNLSLDPGETNNLAKTEGRALQEMAARLEQIRVLRRQQP
jgi:arylsulfatase A-like enzyme